MLFSKLFTKTERTFPKDEEAINAKYLMRAGFIKKMSAGVFAYLPLAYRVIEKINAIIRKEMRALGAEELLMPALVAKEYWTKSSRWGVEVVYKLKSPAGDEFGLGWTHEEVIASIAQRFINSYKDLPKAAYQIQTKFRAEPRAKNGLLRGREFMMKDLYSFHADKADLDRYYVAVMVAYEKILQQIGLQYLIAEASGGAFTKDYTHEFQVLSEAGEDVVFYCEKCRYAQNKEVAQAVNIGIPCPKCGGTVAKGNAIEVANVFRLGTRYSEAFDVKFKNAKGEMEFVTMGSYGIGPSRILATVVEVSHDDRGMIWQKNIAPFAVHLISLGADEKVQKEAKKLYVELEERGVEVLYDDRDASAGEKLADADAIGVPLRVILSEKTMSAKKIEVKERANAEAKLITGKELFKKVASQ